jgi:outer membrane receptor protein involved in Fe transport
MDTTERLDQEITSLFGEVSIPATDDFEIQLGVRYSDYEASSVTKPRASFIWDATDIFSLRFSYEETYRVPLLSNNVQESLQRYAPLGEYVTIATPVASSLQPEESQNMNLGFIIRPDERSQITFDYFSIAFTNGFGTEAATCPCAEIVYVTPGDPNSGIARIETELINGDDVDISGLDFEGTVGFDAGNTVMQFSYGGTYLTQYDVAGAISGGTYDALGKFNTRSADSPINLRSVPELQLYLGLGIEIDIHSINMYVRHVGEYDVPDTITAAYQFIDKIDSMNTLDFNYSVRLADDRVRINLSAYNLLGEDPPLAPSELGYDAYSHSPVGTIIKAGLQYRF